MDNTTACDDGKENTLQVGLEGYLKYLKGECVERFGFDPKGEQRAAQIAHFFSQLTAQRENSTTLLGDIAYNEILHKGSAQGIVAFCAASFGLTGNDSYRLSQLIAEERDALKEVENISNGKTAPKKKYESYRELIEETFKPRRCLLSEELMTFDSRLQKWLPVANRLGVLESYCRDNEKKGWSATALDCHFRRFESEAIPQPLIDAVEWDGDDRIKKLARALVCVNFDQDQVTELVKDWGAKMMRRINDPHVRNRILVLKGPQEIGKDWWLDALVGGFAPARYVKNLSVSHDREALRMLHKAIVFKIAEFDRTSKMEVGLLKHLITAPDTDERLPYARSDESRVVRASFVATANVDDILRDTTGGTRFIILDVNKIDFSYPGANNDPKGEAHRAQVLAQFKHLADTGYFSSEETETVNKAYISSRTPEHPDQMILQAFYRRVENYQNDKIREYDGTNGWRGRGISKDDAEESIAVIARDEKLGSRHIKMALSRCGIDDKNRKLRFWRLENVT